MNQSRRFKLGYGVTVSLAVHVCILLPLVIWMLNIPRSSHRSSNRLNVEISGILAPRQTAAQQQRRIASPLPKPAEPIQKRNKINRVAVPEASPPIEPHVPQMPPPSNVPNALEPVRAPQIASTQHQESKESKAQTQAGTEAQQPQQTIAAHNNMNDRIAAYMSQLTKQLQSNLIYPQDAKKKRIEGTSLVSFVITESGEIQPNTLAVKRSSGNTTLDASALRTVASSAPFQKPPRELNVSIELEFEVDSKIF
jgi:protein TonB